jgi:hypothetical protein
VAEETTEKPIEEVKEKKTDAKSRGLRTLLQTVIASVLTFLGALGADMAVPGFELDLQLASVGLGIAVLAPVLAYLQRMAGK